GEAKEWDFHISNDLQNGGEIPLVWKKSGDFTLNGYYQNSGTIIVPTGDVTLGDFRGSDKPMGIIAQTGNVSIIKSADSADESMDNVGIYAPNGTVTINLQGFKSSFYFSGTIVANKVEIIPSAGDVGGSITWSSQFA
ncbi:hypothetical protein COT79_00655, partial [Candidatus Berkelbacteria bacterium CG10_big_fil_rev_8_21_14_0_10_43_14]